MKIHDLSLLVSIGTLTFAGIAFAQVPSTNDTSDGFFNTGMGTGALQSLAPNTCQPDDFNIGCYNTAAGYQAQASLTTGGGNSAFGYQALFSNMANGGNSAFGYQALYSDASPASGTGGYWNTALGFQALYSNTTASYNTAIGIQALHRNTVGEQNTASGVWALYNNTSGNYNTAAGVQALYSNTAGEENTASGYQALLSNGVGRYNTASGYRALYANDKGRGNTATGFEALNNNTSGLFNIAEGYKAGINLTTGSNNIHIGNQGAADDTNTIKIGTQHTQNVTYIAGIYGNTLSGLPVVVLSSGRLGVMGSSSERFKTAVAPMGPRTAQLQQLRPVTFHYKANPNGALQYGLIAEEVAKVYPDLVIRDESGRIDGVRYDELAPMLLNEVQQLTAKIRKLEQAQTTVGEVQKQLSEVHAALLKLQARDEFTAQR